MVNRAGSMCRLDAHAEIALRGSAFDRDRRLPIERYAGPGDGARQRDLRSVAQDQTARLTAPINNHELDRALRRRHAPFRSHRPSFGAGTWRQRWAVFGSFGS